MRAHRLLLATVTALLPVVAVSASDAETPKAYLIEANFKTIDANGQERILGQPRLLTLEGQEACIRIGDNLAPPKGVDIQEPLYAGLHCSFKVHRKDGRTYLDANVNRATGSTDADGVQLATQGMRVIKAISLGKKTTVTQGDSRIELVVYQWQGEPLSQYDMPAPTSKSTPAAKPAALPQPSPWLEEKKAP
jgi:hypothetical protein